MSTYYVGGGGGGGDRGGERSKDLTDISDGPVGVRNVMLRSTPRRCNNIKPSREDISLYMPT
jgi:hypothetical protein